MQPMINWCVCLSALALGILAGPLGAAPPTLEIRLSPAQTRVDVPVAVDWTPPMGGDSWQLEEVGPAGAGVLLCQRSSAPAGAGQASRLYFLLPPVSPLTELGGQPVTRKFQLLPATLPPALVFQWEDQGDGRLVLTEGERGVLTYVYGMTLPAGVPCTSI